MSDVTGLLESNQQDDAGSSETLLALVYKELRKLAAHKMANEAPGQTLQPTALVHEAWLRLMGNAPVTFENRAHFFAAAAEAMRRILIERARKRGAQRRGGGLERVPMHDLEVPSPEDDEQMLQVNEALDKLAAQRPVEAELVKLRFFAGMTNAEAAEALGISARSGDYYWNHARAWLFHEISSTS